MGFWVFRADKPVFIAGNQAFMANALLRGIVWGMVGVFTPIFVYRETGSIYLVLAYYFILRLTILLSAISISHLIEKLGFRRSIMISVVIYILFFVVMAFANGRYWLLPLAAFLSGLEIPFYWISRHSAISQDTVDKEMGKTVGGLVGVEGVASFMAPFLGGVIIASYGYSALYAIAGILLFVSLLPLFMMPPHTHSNGASWRGLGEYVRNRRFFHQAVGLIGKVGCDYGLFILWPLVMMILLIRVETIGLIVSLATIFGVGLRFVVGRVFDRLRSQGGRRDEVVFGIVSVVVVVLLLLRMQVMSVYQVTILEVITSMVMVVYSGFFLSYFQLGGKRMGSIAYYVYGEMIYSIGVLSFLAIVALGVFWGAWREIAYVVASFWVLLGVVIARESNLK